MRIVKKHTKGTPRGWFILFRSGIRINSLRFSIAVILAERKSSVFHVMKNNIAVFCLKSNGAFVTLKRKTYFLLLKKQKQYCKIKAEGFEGVILSICLF